MALIKCPKCQSEISDKADTCIHCGEVINSIEQTELKCLECGQTLSEDDVSCPKCGCPVQKEKDSQNVKTRGILINSKVKKILIIVTVILVLFLMFFIGYTAKLKNDYAKNLEKIQVHMLDGGSDAENMCNLTSKVWYNSIHEERDEETDEFTRPDGWFVDDFNEALSNLYSDSETISNIDDIKDNQEVTKELMRRLKNPPNKYEKCYETLLDMYASYKTLTDLAVSPSGSYNDFVDNKSNAISEFVSLYEKLDNIMPK